MRTRFTRLRAALALVVVAGGLTVIGGSGASATVPQSCPASQPNCNNYAGFRTCPVAGFDQCTNATDVEQTSAGGQNVFEPAASSTGGKAIQHNTTGPNTASCVIAANVSGQNTTTNQLCDFTQDGNGGNTIVADMRATHSFTDTAGVAALAEAAVMTLKGNQTSSIGNNTVTGPGGAPALMQITQSLTSNVSGSIPPNQHQERLSLLDVDQVASSSGSNSVNFNLLGSQDADATGLHPTQNQDVDDNGLSDPNARAFVYQRTNSGTNYVKGRGTDDKHERTQSLDSAVGGSATQTQWHTSGGFQIEADVDSAANPSGGTVDFGTPPTEGQDCHTVDGFRKLGEIETLNALGQPTTAGTRAQNDGLPIRLPGTSPNTATVGGCSYLVAPEGTTQTANLSVNGHAKDAITGAIAATLVSGDTVSDYVPFDDQTVNVALGCTQDGCVRTSGGVTGSGVDVSATQFVPFTGPVATFTNDNPSRPVTSAEINWNLGDGSDPSGGTITDDGGSFTVSGTHRYESAGSFPIRTTLYFGDGSEAAVMTSTATVDALQYEYLPAGSFVIGDKSGEFGDASIGSHVTYWSDQWSALNPLSSGKPAPSAFKGFENTISDPTCTSGIWQTKTGNSPPPPPGSLPRYMATIVSSSVTAKKSTPTGNIAHIVIVDTLGTTYGPTPSTPGTGVVIGVIC